MLGEDAKKANRSEFQNLICYFVFILKLCSKNGISESEDKENADEEVPTKKVKTSLDLNSKESSAKKENPHFMKNASEGTGKPLSTNNWRALTHSSFHFGNGSKLNKIFKKRTLGSPESSSSSTINMLNQFSLKSDKPLNKCMPPTLIHGLTLGNH